MHNTVRIIMPPSRADVIGTKAEEICLGWGRQAVKAGVVIFTAIFGPVLIARIVSFFAPVFRP
jgi:hypothetical protein